MIYTCPFCRSLFEMGDDHLSEPCSVCWRAGWRIDSCGNKWRVAPEAAPSRWVEGEKRG